MAFENNYQQQQYSPTLYGYSTSHPQSVIDKTNLNTSMWKGSIKIAITPLVEAQDGTYKMDYKGSINIFLTPTKALIFADILKKFIEDPVKYSNYGVASGKGLITICHASMFNKEDAGPVLNIKIITEGKVEQSYSYEFRKEYNAVVGFDEKDGSFKQDYSDFEMTEIKMLIIQLEEYVKAMTNSQAFAVINNQYPYMEKIAGKLGVDLSNRQRSGGYSANSYFNNPNNSSGTVANNGGSIPHNDLSSMMSA